MRSGEKPKYYTLLYILTCYHEPAQKRRQTAQILHAFTLHGRFLLRGSEAFGLVCFLIDPDSVLP